MDSQMKKGILEMCLLQMIASRETYGYELMAALCAAFPGVNESTVYAILRRLQNDGHLETYAGERSGGPARRYFRLSATGRQALAQAVADWHALTAAVTSLGIC